MNQPLLFSALLSVSLACACSADQAASPADDEPPPTPGNGCADVPAAGRCVDGQRLERCVQPTDGVSAFVAERTCAANEVCRVVDGTANCVQAGDCRPGASSCVDDSTLRVCEDGVWSETVCQTSCRGSALGASCAPDVAVRSVQGRLEHEVRRVNATFDGLQPAVTEASTGMLMLSYHAGEILDAAVTATDGSAAGTFVLEVAAEPGPDDFIGAVTASLDGERVLYAVADHGIPQDVIESSQLEALIGEAPPSAKLWGWSWPSAQLPTTPTFTITEAEGAGAAHLFRRIGELFAGADELYPNDTPRSLVAWFRKGVSYSAAGTRAAFFQSPNDPEGVPFDSQFIVGDDGLQDIWNDDLITHELAHHWMWSHSYPISEGGNHLVFQKSLPGLAFSEGFANWFPLALKGSPQFDFSVTEPGVVDFAAGTGVRYENGAPVTVAFDPTTPDKPLIQGISEAEVTQVLWRLGTAPDGRAAILRALAQPRLLTAPFERGYTLHEATYAEDGTVNGYRDTGTPVVMLADLLDALICSGFDPTLVDQAVEASTRYPYPASAPLCR